MDNAALIFCFRESSGYGFLYSDKSVGADDHDILYSTVLEVVQDRKPVLGTFVFAYFDCQYFFVTLEINAKDDIVRETDRFKTALDMISPYVDGTPRQN